MDPDGAIFKFVIFIPMQLYQLKASALPRRFLQQYTAAGLFPK
jgi:hypothetical protein